MSEVQLGTLYDMNKQIMIQLPPLTGDEYRHQLTNICGWFSSNNKHTYYMFLNRERADYTVFNFKTYDYSKALNEVREVIDYRGELLSVEYIHGEDLYDIWLNIDGEAFMYKLFPCDDFIIEI